LCVHRLIYGPPGYLVTSDSGLVAYSSMFCAILSISLSGILLNMYRPTLFPPPHHLHRQPLVQCSLLLSIYPNILFYGQLVFVLPVLVLASVLYLLDSIKSATIDLQSLQGSMYKHKSA
jgi:hypothetical protein